MKVYIGGAMAGRETYIVKHERKYVKDILRQVGIAYYDPMEDETVDWPIVPLGYDQKTMVKFRDKDYKNINKCTHFLNINGDLPSVGTCWEMAYFKMTQKGLGQLIIVSPKMYNKELCNFTTVEADKIFERVESAILYLQGVKDNAFTKRNII